ncbi:MAG: murG [Rickettsiaceae bacterium]|jgi:UDP-N-acetylglucosamine--N-acetylmuramyl-(pentapeptide) pyrophosphoryl-undecaprenol N-acetylglucosamine transferase|nr:murG [Rickettsiaceae bacterium]
MRKKRDRIFVVGGGTGGHMFPAIALGQELATRNYKVYLITDPRCAKYLNNDIGLKVKIIKSQAAKTGVLSRIQAGFSMMIGLIESLLFLIKTRPKIVIGFGGYTMFPMLFAAQLLGIPIMLHEQNSFLGKANLFFAAKAKLIALTFQETTNIPDHCLNKLVVTGNPVRKEIKSLVVSRDFKRIEKFNILIIGGSQGAKFFSTLIPNAIRFLIKLAPHLQLHIIQQAHKADWIRLKRAYKRLGVEFELAEFFYDMPKRYQESHLAICRAGASTISEFINVELPAIYLPLPSAANNHQVLNAQFIERNKAGWYFEQSTVTPQILADKIFELATKPQFLVNAASNLKKLQKDTEIILADTVEKIIKPEKTSF